MTPVDHEVERWKTAQVAALITRGVNPLDAHAAVDRLVAKLPAGADPDTYVPSDNFVSVDVSSTAVTDDARAAWYSDEDIPARFKRILDAKVGE